MEMEHAADPLSEWVAGLVSALHLPRDTVVDVDLILNLARQAAHSVARPAAPVTTFLVGYAAGLAGGFPADVARFADIAATLAAGRSPHGTA